MKKLIAGLFLVLLWASPTAHALVCDDGLSLAATEADCPAKIDPLAPADVDHDSGAITGIGDAQAAGATHYVYASTSPYPPGCSAANYTHANLSSSDPQVVATAVRAKQYCTRHDIIRSGSGASFAVNSQYVYVAGQFWAAFSGATPETTYYFHYELQGGPRRGAISLVHTTEVTMDASPGGGGGGGTPVETLTGKQRYIKNGGNDLADGLSDANAWASLSKCASSLPAGTDCNLKSGSTWTNETLSLEHGGTAEDPVWVRTYEMSGSDHMATAVGGTQAIIQGGSLNSTCLTAGTCDYRWAAVYGAGLSGQYDSYLYVAHTADWSYISNIWVRRVHTLGIIAQGNWPTQGSLHHVHLQDMRFTDIGLSVILFENGVSDFVIRRNTVEYYGTCAQQRQMGGTNYSDLCPTAIFPAGGAIARSYPARALLEDNFFGPGAGEGFDCHSGSTYVIMRGNTLVRLQSGALYPDGCNHVVIEGNISIGPRGETFGYYDGPGTGFGGGFASVVEDWQGAGAPNQINVYIRNNLSIATEYSTSWGMFSQQVARGKQVGGYDVGNTHIDSITYALYIEPSMTNTNVPALRYSNNLNWDQSNGAAGCVAPNLSNITNTHNHKYVSWSDSDCNDATDTSGDPLLAVSNYATWAAYNIGNLPTFANAKPQAGSPANNAGTPLTTTVIDYTAYGYAATQMADVLSGAITLENWAKILYYDALDQARSATTPDIGCCEGP